ncbi:MAG: hypothetical protein ABI579_07300 [Candidatus Sumerlaeota bacterium]
MLENIEKPVQRQMSRETKIGLGGLILLLLVPTLVFYGADHRAVDPIIARNEAQEFAYFYYSHATLLFLTEPDNGMQIEGDPAMEGLQRFGRRQKPYAILIDDKLYVWSYPWWASGPDKTKVAAMYYASYGNDHPGLAISADDNVTSFRLDLDEIEKAAEAKKREIVLRAKQ